MARQSSPPRPAPPCAAAGVKFPGRWDEELRALEQLNTTAPSEHTALLWLAETVQTPI